MKISKSKIGQGEYNIFIINGYFTLIFSGKYISEYIQHGRLTGVPGQLGLLTFSKSSCSDIKLGDAATGVAG